LVDEDSKSSDPQERRKKGGGVARRSKAVNSSKEELRAKNRSPVARELIEATAAERASTSAASAQASEVSASPKSLGASFFGCFQPCWFFQMPLPSFVCRRALCCLGLFLRGFIFCNLFFFFAEVAPPTEK
jgi:hypothetical protein